MNYIADCNTRKEEKRMRVYKKLTERQREKFQINEEKIWKVLRKMTIREIALSSVRQIAEEAGVGRNTLYNHRSAYEYIVDCRRQEAERAEKAVKGNK